MNRSVAAASPQPEPRQIEPVLATTRRMTAAQWQQFGLAQLAYVKTYRVKDRGLVYVTHAADGSAIAMADRVDVTMRHASEKNLLLVAVH